MENELIGFDDSSEERERRRRGAIKVLLRSRPFKERGIYMRKKIARELARHNAEDCSKDFSDIKIIVKGQLAKGNFPECSLLSLRLLNVPEEHYIYHCVRGCA